VASDTFALPPTEARIGAQNLDDLVIGKFFVTGGEDDDVDAPPTGIGTKVFILAGRILDDRHIGLSANGGADNLVQHSRAPTSRIRMRDTLPFAPLIPRCHARDCRMPALCRDIGRENLTMAHDRCWIA
jgi:hypothetical protein